jgi:hypothetical protein
MSEVEKDVCKEAPPSDEMADFKEECVMQTEQTKESGKKLVEKQEKMTLMSALAGPLKDIQDNYGATIDIDKFCEGVEKAFKKNGTHIGIMAAKIKENPKLVYDIVTARIKEFAIKCADDPIQCVSDIHGKAVDFLSDFFLKTDKEDFKNFAYDIGQATGEVLSGLGTLGGVTVSRIVYLNPELKDPKDYPGYLAKNIKPRLNKYLTPESQKQLDIFIDSLAKEISYVDMKKLQQLFGAIEQFAKDCENGIISATATIKTISQFFLDVVYRNISSFDPRPIIQDMMNIASDIKNKNKNIGEENDPERLKKLKQKFLIALVSFSVEHGIPLLDTYFALRDRTKIIPDRRAMGKALDELIVFRFSYCKDISNEDFIYMMEYAKNTGMGIDDPKINKILTVR